MPKTAWDVFVKFKRSFDMMIDSSVTRKPSLEVALTFLATFSCRDNEFWTMTLTLESDLYNVKMNQQAEYLCERHFVWNLLSAHTHTHTHTHRIDHATWTAKVIGNYVSDLRIAPSYLSEVSKSWMQPSRQFVVVDSPRSTIIFTARWRSPGSRNWVHNVIIATLAERAVHSCSVQIYCDPLSGRSILLEEPPIDVYRERCADCLINGLLGDQLSQNILDRSSPNCQDRYSVQY